MALNDIFRLALVGIGPSAQELVNVHYFRQLTAPGQDTGEELAVAFGLVAVPLYADCIASTCLMTEITVRNVTQPQFGFDAEINPAEPGTNTGDSLPGFSAGLIHWRTGLIGRSRRGRTFVWPNVESGQNAGQWIPAVLTAMSAFANGIITLTEPVSGAQYQRVVWSETLQQAFNVTNATAEALIAVQRRRKAGVGS